MTHRWQLFWLIEAALFMILCYQIVTNPPVLVGVVLGVLALVIGAHVKHGKTFWLTIGLISVVISVFVNPMVWIMLFMAACATMHLLSGRGNSNFGPWAKKQFFAVTTKEPQAKAGMRHTRPWFGDTAIGQTQYEWDDINMTVAAGDTIIDLGNTYLPKGENVIVIRKGFGKTRVLIPVGVGVAIEHSAVIGNLSVNGEEIQMKNETMQYYSDDYDTASRRVHLLTNVLVGDVEVLAV
ncbi:cell wall-active antibiotics response protein LiaF [Lacticaseibacillus sp. GG6-2]